MDKTQTMEHNLNVSSIITAILAAGLWLGSALVRIPSNVGIHDIINFLFIGVKDNEASSNTPATGRQVGENLIIQDNMPEKVGDLLASLKKQSCLSAFAAFFAGISAICQAVAMYIHK